MKSSLPISRAVMLVLLAITLLSACDHRRRGITQDTGTHGGTGGPSQPPASTVAKVIVTPASVLLQPGETSQLSAHAVDANGTTIDNVAITWTTVGSAVTVAQDGKVTAATAIDSAVIRATVGSVSSAPVTALVASLVPGSQIIKDSQVVSDPALVDTTQEPGVGSLLQMVLSGLAPAVGAVIVGSGDKPISGRVVSATPNGFDDFNNRYRETKGLSSTAHAGVALAMWDSSGGILWRKTIKNERRSTADGGFLYSEEASGRIVLNDTGRWAMIGTTGEFPGTTAGGDWDAALFSINPQTGDPNLIRLYASAGSDELFLFGPTPGGGLLVTGETTGSLFGPNLGAYDVVAAALAADGTPRWTEQFGGPGTDKGAAVAAGSDGSIYLTGFTDGLMPATLSGLPAGTPLNTHAGGRDFFITKMGAAEGTIQVAHPHF